MFIRAGVIDRLPRWRILKRPGFVFCLLLFALCSFAHAGITGKLAGRVLEQQKQALPGANVVILGTSLGGAADLEGYYSIINIPPGTYRVQFSYVGYQSVLVQNILISADKTTTQNAELNEETITTETVVVTAQRPVIETNLTSSISTVTSEDIAALPVQALDDIVNLQAGVVDGHFRGGRLGEVQYQINGVTVNNAYDNSSTLRVDRSLLQEVQVISGTFDAEYGQAMSGVVNAVLKSGSEKFAWSAEVFTSDYFFSGAKRNKLPGSVTLGLTSAELPHVDDEFKPFSLQNYQFSLSGPTFVPQTTFILNARRNLDDGYIYGARTFQTNDRANFETKVFTPTGDGEEVPLATSREWSGLFKITNRSLPNIEVSYQAIGNDIEARGYDFGFYFNPDGASTQRTRSLVHGLDWTHTLSKSAFYNVSVRQNYFDYTDFTFADVNDPRYDAAGPSSSDATRYLGLSVQGVDLGRFQQQTNSYVAKGSVTSQVSRSHSLKFGGEFLFSDVEFGTPGGLIRSTDGTSLDRRYTSTVEIPFQELESYQPFSLSAYAQDQMEWHDLIVRAGLRWEYFDARASLPSDLQNPANAIQGVPLSTLKSTTVKSSVAPRLGVSYPITTQAALFFAYGHFYQFPGLGQIFNNSDYSILRDLQAGGISYGVLGNPDIKPERTVQYEFGYKHAINENLGLDFSVFYKDIRDLLGVEFISTYAAAEYARLTNIDFGSILGYTIALDQRRFGLIGASVDYTWQRAQGNASDPRETATRASAGEDPRPRQVPLNWDQRNTLNATISVDKPNNFSISTVIRYGSGQPYTPEIGSGFGSDIEANSGRKSSYVLMDVRAEKFFKVAGVNTSFFVRVFNLLDTRFYNGFVFSNTGSPDYSLNPAGDRTTLANPGRYYPPRRIELGFSLNSAF